MKRSIVIGTALILGIALAAVLAIAFKLSYYRIETGSMEPSFPVGTIVVPSGTAKYQYGNPITFEADGHVLTHCFLGFNGDGSLITRGIANTSNDTWDTPVYPKDVRGRVMFQILLFAPSFWLSRSGVGVVFGIYLIVLAMYLWRRSDRTGPPQDLESGWLVAA